MFRHKNFSRIHNPNNKEPLTHHHFSSIIKEYPLLRHLKESRNVEVYAARALSFLASMNEVTRQLKRHKTTRLIDEQIIITSVKDFYSVEIIAGGVLKVASLQQLPKPIPRLWIPADERVRFNIVIVIVIRYSSNRSTMKNSSFIEEVVMKKNYRHRILKRRFGI